MMTDTYDMLGGQKPEPALSELDRAVRFANRVLERVSADPADDLTVLARQFLSVVESLDGLRSVAGAASPGKSFADIRSTLPQSDPHPER